MNRTKEKSFFFIHLRFIALQWKAEEKFRRITNYRINWKGKPRTESDLRRLIEKNLKMQSTSIEGNYVNIGRKNFLVDAN